MIFLVAMVLGGIFGAVLSNAKGRSIGWIPLCFLMPIFVILLMVLPSRKKAYDITVRST